MPDPDRLGGLGWTRRTGGRLSRAERRRLLLVTAVGQWTNAVGRIKLALGRIPEEATRVDLHATPGITVDADGAMGCYLQWGAMVDGVRLRIWDIAPGNVAETLRRYPRGDFKRDLVSIIRAEAGAVPAGRMGLLVRCGLPLAVRLAPFDS
ncbi:hypothetical protein OK015_02680 [Mycobacterium sp. Aquia_216]|uniref:hypothetical protein n=1 Tax=Mycobacterium sp. Aquia_216 TaxID=2991729 RepID=UPI00227D1BDB|nr:hypothetical protein [Mycobacterium sp. Aquia_216]WAJ45448.1 hypothetical protein OK015_02680 [Mycobacterium sp. Aquia_216]